MSNGFWRAPVVAPICGWPAEVPTSAGYAATEAVVYSFKGRRDGASPAAGLICVHGEFYGITSAGGRTADLDTVFAVTPDR